MHRWLVPHVVFPLYEGLSGRRPWSTMRQLEAAQWRPPDETAARQLGRVRALLAHARAQVPHYRDLLRQAGVAPGDLRTLADLAAIPVTTRAALRAAFPDRAVAGGLPARRRLAARTSGSTGEPLEFYLDRTDADIRRGSYLLFRQWAGAPPWYTRVLVAIPSFVPPHYRPSRGLGWSRRLLLGERVAHLHTDRLALPHVQATIRALARRPYFLYGPPSYLAHLAALLLDAEAGLPRAPALVIACGETLTALDALLIQRAFGCRVVNHYSTLEVLYLAQTCPDGGDRLHVNAERAVVRVVRPDGRDAAPGETGRVLVTDLANHVMPFINYDLGDLAVAGRPCACGRGWPTLERLDGRVSELIRTPDRVVSSVTLCFYLTDHCDGIPYVRQFQAVQEAPDRVVLRVVPTGRFGPAFGARLQERLEALLGPGMGVRVEAVDRIALEPSEKRLIVRNQASAP